LELNLDNPFESGHIKNYVLFYIGIVVIMVLFFIAATLFNDVDDVKRKIFPTEIKESLDLNTSFQEPEVIKPRFKLLDKAY